MATKLFAQFRTKRVFGATQEAILAEAKTTAPDETPIEWKQFIGETWQPFTPQTLEQKFEIIAPAFTEQRPDLPEAEPFKLPDITPVPDMPTTEDLKVGEVMIDLPEPTAPSVLTTFTTSFLKELETKRASLESLYTKQLEDLNKRIETSRTEMEKITAEQKDIITEDIQPLLQPFREKLETSERERLKLEENFFANQRSISELETLLTTSMEDIKAMEGITGLEAIRNPRIAKFQENVAARVGIIEAVMATRNEQIRQAQILIDRSINAITADRNDQLAYYNGLLDFYTTQKDEEGKRLLALKVDQKEFLTSQIGLIEADLETAEKNVDNIKSLMLDPDTAEFMEKSGVTLTDTPAQVQAKFAETAFRESIVEMNNEMADEGYTYVSTPEQLKGKDEADLRRMTDNRGNSRVYFKEPEVELLSVSEAKALGVPFGTTREQAMAQGIIPTGVGKEILPVIPFKKLSAEQQISVTRLNAQIQRGEYDYDQALIDYPDIAPHLKPSTLSLERLGEAKAVSEANRKIETWRLMADQSPDKYKVEETDEAIKIFEHRPKGEWWLIKWKLIETIEFEE